ncbi:MAG TPA: type II secretion system protein, partial [Verrucomicrobiales bacterium]|nr:type II secretion system protein [Verrucomicrobiales bacterium]
MAEFSYKARRRNGELITGVLEGVDKSAVLNQIDRQGLFPLSVELSAGKSKSSSRRDKKQAKSNREAVKIPPLFRSFASRQRKPKMQELATFTEQLANLLSSGMPLVMALNSASHLQSKGIPSEVSLQLKQDVTEGQNLSDSMAKQPVIFSNLYINMVRAGESSGALVEVLRRLAAHFKRFAEVQTKFKSAMIYPIIVGCVGIAIIFFFMTFMLPKFLQIFDGLDAKLPASTQMLISFSDFFANWWHMMILGVIVLGIVFRRFQVSDFGRSKIDEWKLKVPVLGRVFRMNLFGQFARTLSTLLQNGVPVLTALKITENVIPNVVIQEAICKTREEVTDGKTLAQPLAKSGIFP